MPGTDGLAATRALMADPNTAATRVIILTAFEDEDKVFRAICAGAAGYLLKSADATQITAAIREAGAGG